MEGENYKENNNAFGDFEFNYAVVMHGKLSALEKARKLLESQDGIVIRYQTLDRGRLLITRERED